MDLQRNSREYAHIIFSVTPDNGATIEASMDLITWAPVTLNQGTGLVLLYGPGFSDQSQGLAVTATGKLWIRVTEAPEVIIRSAGIVSLY